MCVCASPATSACHRFGYHSLLTMLAWYFLGASVASGSAISSGLFVPMLMMGATIGRICGLATVDIAEHVGKYIAGAAAPLQRTLCVWPPACCLCGLGEAWCWLLLCMLCCWLLRASRLHSGAVPRFGRGSYSGSHSHGCSLCAAVQAASPLLMPPPTPGPGSTLASLRWWALAPS